MTSAHQVGWVLLEERHDVVVKTLAFEIRRLGIGAVDSDFTMKNDCAHPTSQKRGDIAVTSDGHLELTNAVASGSPPQH